MLSRVPFHFYQCFPNFQAHIKASWDLEKMHMLFQYSGMKLKSSNKLPSDTNTAGTQTKLNDRKNTIKWKGRVYFTYSILLYLIYLRNVPIKPSLIWEENWHKRAKCGFVEENYSGRSLWLLFSWNNISTHNIHCWAHFQSYRISLTS